MTDLEALYATYVDGTATEPPPHHETKRLQRVAMQRARAPDPAERLGALRVAAALGPDNGLPITQLLLRDPDDAVRRYAFNQAVAARDRGILLLRIAAEGPDPALTADALDLLTQIPDTGASPVLQRLTTHDSPSVRARAVRLLGRIAGPSALGRVRRLESDADPEVQEAVQEALERLQGGGEPVVPGQWWDDDAGDITLPAPPAPKDGALTGPKEPAPQSPAPSHALVPVRSEERYEPPLEDGAPLPEVMPTEARALLRLLGVVRPSDRAAVLARLEEVWPEVHALASRFRPEADPVLTRGMARAAAALGSSAWIARLRPLLGAPDVSVRAAALEACGALGQLSVVASVSRGLEDREPTVRLAAVRALEQITQRVDRPDLLRRALIQHGEDPDPTVQAEIARLVE